MQQQTLAMANALCFSASRASTGSTAQSNSSFRRDHTQWYYARWCEARDNLPLKTLTTDDGNHSNLSIYQYQ